eukprot:scaffold45507_cov21-Tisochrysis_lutea.AAC.1
MHVARFHMLREWTGHVWFFGENLKILHAPPGLLTAGQAASSRLYECLRSLFLEDSWSSAKLLRHTGMPFETLGLYVIRTQTWLSAIPAC